MLPVLLITGGYSGPGHILASAEVWAPGLSCSLPSMTRARAWHTLTAGGQVRG